MTTENKFIDNLVTETIEESSEIIQVLCKLQKFGFYDFHPDDKDKTPNYISVLNKISDLQKKLKTLESNILSKIEETRE